jgi:hypothetical protein
MASGSAKPDFCIFISKLFYYEITGSTCYRQVISNLSGPVMHRMPAYVLLTYGNNNPM